MSTLATILIFIAVLLVLLIGGGFAATARRRKADEGRLRAQLEDANRALALAHAQDKGWERGGLEHAARHAFAERSGAAVRELQLVQVVDRPGTEEDQAVFRIITDHGYEYLPLDRRGDAWVAR